MNTIHHFAIVIPVYNHCRTVEAVITEAQKLRLPIFVVDDGSTDDTHNRIRRFENINIIRHHENLGKGAALLSGFSEAAKIANWAITLDADGQHDPADAETLIQTARQFTKAIIIGHRQGMDKPGVQWTSRFGRSFSNFWVRMSGGPVLADSQSGFRIYPLPEVLDWGIRSRRFEFEVEILVLAHRYGVPVLEAPVGVHYLPPGQRVSHFRPWIDFFRNSRTFSRLIFQRLLFRPRPPKKIPQKTPEIQQKIQQEIQQKKPLPEEVIKG